MTKWPNNKFDIENDNANYSCVSTGNTVGPGIKSSTYFSIECKTFNLLRPLFELQVIITVSFFFCCGLV